MLLVWLFNTSAVATTSQVNRVDKADSTCFGSAKEHQVTSTAALIVVAIEVSK